MRLPIVTVPREHRSARPRRRVRRPGACVGAIVGAIVGTVSIAGCAVGPNFVKPAPPRGGGYAARPPDQTVATPGVVGGAAQRFVVGAGVGASWWRLFGSTQLDELIRRALAHNPDLGAARAALTAAHENLLAQRGAYLPGVSAGFAASRARQSTLLAPVPNYPSVPNEFQYDLFTPEVSVSYVPDVFGLNRRTVESARAGEQAVRFEMIATYDTLVANVAVGAIEEAALRAQVAATRRLIATDRAMTRILRLRYAKGYASRLDLAAQQAQGAMVAATLPPLEKALAQQRDLLAVLVGAPPNRGPKNPFALTSLHLPQRLPLSVPSRLVEQRPDVRQAQANLHAASAEIGIAVANRLPDLTLTANAGSTSLALADLFSAGTGFWGIGASLSAPIFEGGALLHRERAAKAAYLQAAEQYRSAVLTAFQNVADCLAALQQDARGLRAAAAADRATKIAFDLSRRQYAAGYAGNLSLFGAEQAYLQARINLIQAQANRFADTAALFEALGGGWWRSADLAGKKR